MELGITQSRLAERLGAQTDTVRNWERGRSGPTLRYRSAILEFLGYDPAPDEPTTLGEKLRKYRMHRGITQKELARQVGIDPTTLSRLERNKGQKCFWKVHLKLTDFLERELKPKSANDINVSL